MGERVTGDSVSVDLITPRQDLVGEVAARLVAEGRDYSANLVVFPGKRPAHFLRKVLAQKEHASIRPPVILSMDSLVDYLYEEVLGLPGRKIETIDAVALLLDIHRKTPRPLGGSGFLTPDSFFPLGIKIYRDIEECLIEGVTVERIREIESLTESQMPPQAVERLQSLSYFFDEFYKLVRDMDLSTRSSRYRAVADGLEPGLLGRFHRVIFAGFFALTAAEEAMFKKLLGQAGALFLFQDGPGIDVTLSGLGVAAPASHSGDDPGTDVRFYKSPDGHGQVFALSDILRREADMKGLPDERTVIVVPSPETLFPLVHQALALLPEDGYNISLGYPLTRTPVYGFFENLMRVMASMDGDRVYIPDYLNFILHPYAKNVYFKGRADVTRVLVHSLEEVVAKGGNRSFLAIDEIMANDEVFRLAADRASAVEPDATPSALRDHLSGIHEHLLVPFTDFSDVADFARKSMHLLAYLSTESTARLHPFFQPFAESFMEHLYTLSRSLLSATPFLERGSYFRFFRRFVATCYSPFEGTPLRGLQALGFLETRNLRFDTVYVLDANEGVIPDAKREDSILPLKARQVLGLPTYQDKERLSRYYFDTLVRGAGQVHLFYVENDQKEKSRFVERLIWQRQKSEGRKDAADLVSTVRYKVRLENRMPGPIQKTAEVVRLVKAHTYSATSLDSYLRCPLQFYHRYVLGLGRREELTGDLEREEIGRFVHDLLLAYFRERTKRPLRMEDANADEMEALADEMFVAKYGADVSGPGYLLKVQVKKHLRDFITRYQQPLIRDHTTVILQLEQPIRVSVGGFSLSGRPDRIERRDGRVFLIDYKTGASAERLRIRFDRLDPADKENWHNAIGSVQLGFYALLYTEGTGEPTENVAPLFLLLGRSYLGPDVELPLFGKSDDPAECFQKVRAVILGLLEEVVDPVMPFTASRDPGRTCPTCDFQPLCGTQWVNR